MRDVFAMSEARGAAQAGSEIVLAQEKPFRLARTLVRPASLELEFESGTIRVEPRVMQVLVALSRTGGEPVSRRRLIEGCWGGRLVTDGALNRSIAQLRKALRDPAIEIGTIPRVGYRLRPPVAAESLPPASGAAPPVSRAVPDSAESLPSTASAVVDSLPTRGMTAGVAGGFAFSRRRWRIAAVVGVALLVLALVVWKGSV